MELHPPASSSDEDVYRLAVQEQPGSALPLSPAPGQGANIVTDAATAPRGPGLTAQTIVADPVVDRPRRIPDAAVTVSATTQSLAQPVTLPADTAESATAAAPGSPAVPADASGPGSSCQPWTTRGSKLRPRRRRRVRLRYLIQAWARLAGGPRGDLVGLGRRDLHVVGRDQEDRQLRLGAGLLPQRRARVAADLRRPGQHPRDRAIGDENASTPASPTWWWSVTAMARTAAA